MINNLIIFGAKYLIFIVCLIFVWFFLLQNQQKKKEMLIVAVFVLPISYIAAKILGFFFYDPRPFVVGNFNPLIPHVADNGFPSDHTLLSGSLAAIAILFDKKIGSLLFLLAFLVGISRVFAGVHHLVDIIGALVIALIVALLTKKLAFQLARK